MIEIAQFNGKSFVSRRIKFFTWGNVSHSAFLIDKEFIAEAWHKGGVQINHITKCNHKPGTKVKVYTILPEFDEDELHHEIISHIGKEYDYAALWGFLVRKERQNKDKLFCSEYVMECLKAVGVHLQNAPAYKVSPTILGWSPSLRLNEKEITIP